MNKIVFYHHHVNGDCFNSRIFVKHIMSILKDSVDYYFTSALSLSSHCLDIGIPDNHFNCIPLPSQASDSVTHFFNNDTLYLNVQVGTYPPPLCHWCLYKFIDYYNTVINNVNSLKIIDSISYIPTDTIPFIPFNYDFYNCKFFNEYFEKIRNVFSKIILVYNYNPITYHLNVNHNTYIEFLSNKYPNYLFLTFNETNMNKDNVKVVRSIYNESNEIPLNYGIEFSYLTFLCDKVIYVPSGLSAISFYNEKNIINKYILLYCTSHWIGIYACDKYFDEYLCTNKYNIFIHKAFVSNNNLTNDLDTFINLPLIVNE